MSERLQKLLARAGYGSRRQLEQVIEAGRIRVNNRVATLGDKADPRDEIRMDGKRLNLGERLKAPCRVLAYKKHVDQVVSRRDPDGRPTVFKGLPRMKAGRWLAVGRLDVNTSGLLLMTTDGELKRRLEHPSYEIVRTYAVRVRGAVDDAMLERLMDGVMLDDGVARFDSIRVSDDAQRANRWFEVTVRQGRNRVVRRLWASQGVTVSRLMRTGFGPVALPGGVKAGGYRELDRKQIRELAATVDLKR
ncbi:pseudouridine synthase [Salinisphaera orenii MK-B5]|uniref:Pseudouridine synthase n=2 Tax=Salinisphaera orenii TaxID=856731 RepID=A0A423PRT2_9GAMM|nr:MULTISPECIES: pseudouridine synthase [Salinisphaera]ROO28316.1 pseudouridine synthase [Salinisphaera orenii MK-B5]ROO32420.1 pseudouridine synthase [Salinisphaera halophila YIM 95161]